MAMRITRSPLLIVAIVLPLLAATAVIATPNKAEAAAPVSASDDAYVVASAPNTSNGSNTTLIEGTLTTTRVIYLKFTVNSVPKNSPVMVQLFSERASNIPARLRAVANTTWSQHTLNWNNRPALGTQIASVSGTPLSDWLTFDVTTVVTKPGTYSFAIDSPAGGKANNVFLSNENSNRNGPRLMVGTTTPPSGTAVLATDDAYVVASAPTTTNGVNATLLEGTLTTTRVIYLKFTVSSLPKNSPVAVQLFSERASKIPARLRVVANTTWSQHTLNWNNRPALGAEVASVAGTPLNDWVTFDVTSVVTKAGTYSFAIDSPAGGTANNVFSAVENSNDNGPRLDIATTNPPPPFVTPKPFFVIYYLWWSTNHWHNRLGPNYPFNATPQPLPAEVDSSGCTVKTLYKGNILTDVSQRLAYQQDGPGVILNDVRLAASLGVTGFAVNWRGEGNTTQTPTSLSYNRRLQAMFDAVHTVNAEGIPFKLMLNYKGSANIVPLHDQRNDFNYFMAHYGKDPALDHTYSSKPEVIYAGTWKYPDKTLKDMADIIRPRMYFIGDEKPATWTKARANYLDGDAYYWSSQNPYRNPQSFEQLRDLSARIHSENNPDGTTKTWLAPMIPGYTAKLLFNSDTCVPRNNGQTLTDLYRGNQRSNPDGWDVISWNEITEGSYLVPLTRYGTFYVNKLKEIIANGG